jgi:hypothetical protein
MIHAVTLDSLRRELTALEADIQDNPDPRVAAAAHFRALIAIYQSGALGASPIPEDAPLPRDARPTPSAPPEERVPRPDVKTRAGKNGAPKKIDQFREAVEYLIRKNGGEASKVDLVTHLTALGLVAGSNPTSNVGSNLHVWRQVFVSDGKGNFRIRADLPETPVPLWDSTIKWPPSEADTSSPQGETGGVAPPVPASPSITSAPSQTGTEAGGT